MIKDKNTHLFHLEELFVKGEITFKQVIHELHSLLKWCQNYEKNSREGIHLTIKYDGSPAVFFGKHPETGQFVIGTKGIFSNKANFASSIKDIEEKFPRTMSFDAKGNKPVELADHLIHLFLILSKIEFDAIYQGDLLYTPDMLKKNASGSAFEFKPNTLTYKVSVSSEQGIAIQNNLCGMVVHTKYTGLTLKTMTAEFLSDEMILPGIWSPKLHRFGNVTVYSSSSRTRATTLIESLLKKKQVDNLDFHSAQMFCVQINSLLRKNKSFPSVDQIMEAIRDKNSEIEQKNDEIRQKNLVSKKKSKELQQFQISYEFVLLFRAIVSCKNRIIKALNDSSLSEEISCFVWDRNEKIISHHEGYVVKSDFIYKMVNREEFSVRNFSDDSPWKVEKKRKIEEKKLSQEIGYHEKE